MGSPFIRSGYGFWQTGPSTGGVKGFRRVPDGETIPLLGAERGARCLIHAKRADNGESVTVDSAGVEGLGQ